MISSTFFDHQFSSFPLNMLCLTVVFFFACALCQCTATKCPNVDPMPDFIIEGISGTWYTIQKTDARFSCITEDINIVDAHKGLYELSENAPSRGLINTFGLQHEHNIKYRMQVAKPSTPAVIDLSIPLLASYKMTVLDTDYDNYAVFVYCNKRFGLLSSSTIIEIVSRTPTLEAKFLESIYSKLLSYSLNPFTINMVDQQQCPERGEKGVIIKAASNIFDSIKHTVGDITGILQPKHPNKPQRPEKPQLKPKNVNEDDPSVTGEYNIDIRSSFT